MFYKYLLVIILSMLFTGEALSQKVQSDSISKAKIAKLEFLVGNWQGTGWMMDRSGKKQEFNQTEKIQFKLDSTTILIEGQGKTNGEIIHNALAIISYDKAESQYRFHSYLQQGDNGEFKAELKEGMFYWYPNAKTRFVLSINEKEQWYEKGEYNQGDNWFQFFEMTLDKR